MQKRLMKNSNLSSDLPLINGRPEPKGLSASHRALVGPVRRTESRRSAHNDSNEPP